MRGQQLHELKARRTRVVACKHEEATRGHGEAAHFRKVEDETRDIGCDK